MQKRSLKKPDGRPLWLYSRTEIPQDIEAPSPESRPPSRAAHLRWHPLRGEWVTYATHRQKRTFLPPPEFNPLAPMTDPRHPTELPAGAYDVAVFENLFPSFTSDPGPAPRAIVETRPACGSAEVVVFTQDAFASLGSLPLERIQLILEVWRDRYLELGRRDDVHYVLVFENRGVEVGVTLHHPHGQIYAYPFIPPVPARELELQRVYYEEHQRNLLEELIEKELHERRRIIYEDGSAVAYMPAFARYAYEVWVAPRRACPSLREMDAGVCAGLARALKTVLLKYDRLWDRTFPYVMILHQAPTDDAAHPEAHLHFEFYPAYRMPGRLKYLAGSELGGGVFTSDTVPEEKVAELQAVDVADELK